MEAKGELCVSVLGKEEAGLPQRRRGNQTEEPAGEGGAGQPVE